MSKYDKFEDDSSSSDSSSHKKHEDKTDAKIVDNSHSFMPPQGEFRTNRLDYNFRKNPLKTWLRMMFPHFTLVSLTVGYMLLLIFFYIVEWLIFSKNTWRCTLYSMGSNYTIAIQRGQFQRLFMPAFLHNDLPHLLWAIFVLLAVGCNAEYYLGTIGYSALMGGSIFLGNAFVAGFRSDPCRESVGASPVIMAVIAFEIIWAVFNFNKMGYSKWLYLLYFGTIFLTSLLDTWVAGWVLEFSGHLGGFIAGLLVSLFFYSEITKFKVMRYGRFAFIAIYAILLVIAVITLFFRNTKRCYANLCRVTLNNPPVITYG